VGSIDRPTARLGTSKNSYPQEHESVLAFAKGWGVSVEQSPAPRPRRRQARGERRIERILEVAAQVFADVGFEAATTNAIAARADMSPGSLYQFFPNKDAIAEALASRFAQRLRATREDAFAPEIAGLPLDEMIDRVVDPLVAFYVAHPGFLALFAGSDVSPRLAAVTRDFHEGVVERAERILMARAPHLAPDKLARVARVSVQIVRAMLPLIASVDRSERSKMIDELKAVQRGYLAPVVGRVRVTRAPRERGPARRSHSGSRPMAAAEGAKDAPATR
jgi:AcrR family transcriptional regulator